MKKVTFTLFLIGSIFITMLTLNAVSFLSNLRTPPAGLNISQLLHGQFLQLLALKEYWANFPNLPALSMLFLPNALIVMLLLIGSVIYYLEYRQQAQPQITGAALLWTAMIPYGIGQLVLLGNGKLENAGVWLAFMLTVRIPVNSATDSAPCRPPIPEHVDQLRSEAKLVMEL